MNADSRHRAQFRQLWIDKVRDQLEMAGNARQLEFAVRITALAALSGVDGNRINKLPPEVIAMELKNYGMVGSLQDIAIRSLKARGYPERELTVADDWESCQVRVGAALNWSCANLLRSPETQIMLLDDRTATAVAHSKNVPITAAELQHLPHNPCLIEFYRPIEIAETVKRGVRVRAVGFHSVGEADAPASVMCFYLDYWEPSSKGGGRWPATIAFWFGGIHAMNVDNAARVQIGFQRGSAIEGAIIDSCKYVARNLWDFVTSRSIRYEQVERKPIRRNSDQSQSNPGAATLDRQVSFLYLSRDCHTTEPNGSQVRGPVRPWDHRIEVPGTFHEFVYCAKCGDLHRHDLLGQNCRHCGEVVGPRINVRVEKYWHSPHVKGPEGTPLQEVVRDLHRRKKESPKGK